ncbi:uncharacterized protein LOC101847735 [Aplysia californica]|uniref:Uncharacterized protein LOC101847735 n=1 Tax=Aplysia californica TaxID=6500 RepID=A0ABM0JTY6_APLCA|nr:uncharacterized protein LOC101847735 [Aplysia californica]XP_005101425.1 uncharacterized protein LOC101847735 [Aplysia californica]XP_005101426.1 uncharacterized protein LOC101847735 [Aplysia californica]XP_005101428.1 uncharacterized protein LOC101847735 [Aplysia californica]
MADRSSPAQTPLATHIDYTSRGSTAASSNANQRRPEEVKIDLSSDSEGKESSAQHEITRAKSDEADGENLPTFSVVEHEKNTSANPRKEDTFALPHLVRRIDSAEVLPKPFKSTNQLICAAFSSIICCIVIGAFAAKYAMKAKIQRNKGTYSSAQVSAKRAFYLVIAAVVCGILIVTIVLATNLGGDDGW